MRAWTAIVAALMLAPATAATLYKWVGDDGVLHFSDRPHPGAEVIELEEAQTFAAPPVVERAPARSTGGTGPGFTYNGFWIAAPRGGETLWNIEGNLNAALSLSPPLQPGHRLRVYLDDAPVPNLPDDRLTFTIPEVYRGTHTLRATAVDADGNVIAETAPVTFYVQQTSILSPSSQKK